MNKFRFLALALAALMFASCSKDKSNEDAYAEIEKPAILNLSFASGDAGSKASGEAADDADKTIEEYVVYVFNEGGASLTGFPKDIQGQSLNQKLEVTTFARSIYVVANGGAKDGKLLSNVNTEKALLDLSIDRLRDQEFFTESSVVMSGTNTEAIKFSDTDSPEATVTVLLTFPVSKLRVTIQDSRTNSGDPGSAGVIGETTAKTVISDTHVAVLYSGAKFPLFTAAIVNKGKNITNAPAQNVHATFLSGINSYIGFTGNTGTTTTQEQSSHHYDEVVKTDANKWAEGNVDVDHHFYVAANDSELRPTILTIIGTKTITDATSVNAGYINGDSEIFYPVRFSAKMEAPFSGQGALEVATSYNITIKLTGDISIGKGCGVLSPETDEPLADMNITITPASWTTVKKEIIFN